MQLQPGEKAILAYFADSTNAETAYIELKQMGIYDARMDPIQNRYRRSSLSSMSMAYRTGESLDPQMYGAYGPLLAASTNSSGLSSAGNDDYYSHMISLICPAETAAQAVEIIRRNGGIV